MEGHTLVIPKEHYVTLDQVPGELAGACMAVVPKLARALMEATGTCGWNILQNNGRVAGQEVFHVHFHVVPRKRGDSLSSTWCGWRVDALKKTEGERLSLAVQQALLDRSEKNEAEGKTETKK
ncbi:Protein kinase C1 inhibitor, variant 2 [Balamuthia mandrillaris]